MECTKVKSCEVVGEKVFQYDCTPEFTWGVTDEEAGQGQGKMVMMMVNIY